jgi:uncharacterized protein YyaL (SSP411 family)
MSESTNALINETSPYLLQHARNPVNWQPWGDKALEEARESNKLIIISVGYAACHWCHVMERESFENEEVAEIMNRHYISIKVDREERPDVDQVYMDAAQLLTGRGGWPLNVIALPDGRPIYAGTYFNREQWMKVLLGVQDFFVKTPEKAQEQAMQVASGVSKMNYLPINQSSEFKHDMLKQAVSDWLNAMDHREGGRAGQMKFPMPAAYMALLKHGVAYGNQRAKDLVRLTLDKMASGGLYDQIGGGFSRYSVDPYWHVPHFEKMLYDNAQLIALYSEAFKYFNDPFYLQIVNETIAFCLRELQSDEGGFISAIDADSEGEEGKFYVWTAQEIDEVLEGHSPLFKALYGVTAEGNWEQGKNVLKMTEPIDQLVKEHGLSAEEIGRQIAASRELLFNAREKRIRPTADDKILTSWNALMVSGLTHAYEASGNEVYRELARDTAKFLMSSLWDGNQLKRAYKDGKATINGFLDDYAFMISALIRLYAITFDKEWIEGAESLLRVVIRDFSNEKSGFFNFKSIKDKELFVRKQVLEDNVIPAGNSEMAKNLFFLGTLLENQQYLELSKRLTLLLEPRISEHAAFYYNWFDLYSLNSSKFLEIAIMGEDWDNKRLELARQFIPYHLVSGGHSEIFELLKGKLIDGKTLIYVCLDKTCQAPSENFAEIDLSSYYLVR